MTDLTDLCESGREASARAITAPDQQRGYHLAALANHVRQCETCRKTLDTATSAAERPRDPFGHH